MLDLATWPVALDVAPSLPPSDPRPIDPRPECQSEEWSGKREAGRRATTTDSELHVRARPRQSHHRAALQRERVGLLPRLDRCACTPPPLTCARRSPSSSSFPLDPWRCSWVGPVRLLRFVAVPMLDAPPRWMQPLPRARLQKLAEELASL